MAASLQAALDWITGNKLPLGESIASGVDRLTQSAPWLFDAVSDGLSALVLGFTVDRSSSSVQSRTRD